MGGIGDPCFIKSCRNPICLSEDMEAYTMEKNIIVHQTLAARKPIQIAAEPSHHRLNFSPSPSSGQIIVIMLIGFKYLKAPAHFSH